MKKFMQIALASFAVMTLVFAGCNTKKADMEVEGEATVEEGAAVEPTVDAGAAVEAEVEASATAETSAQ